MSLVESREIAGRAGSGSGLWALLPSKTMMMESIFQTDILLGALPETVCGRVENDSLG